MAASSSSRPARPGETFRALDTVVVGRTGHPIPVRDYRPLASTSARPLFWTHGGGFMTGGLDMVESDAVARAVAGTGRAVRTVDYRLVPMVKFRGRLALAPSDNRYPAPLHDVLDAFLDLTADSPQAPILGGASAGANLALSAALRLRDDEDARPSALLLVYGTFHGRPAPMSAELRSRVRIRDRALQMLLGPDSLERMNINYAGSAELLDDRTVFPGGGDLHDLPPTLLLDADRDGLRASGTALASDLRAAGVDVETSVLGGAVHGFLNKATTEDFAEGVRRIVTWLNRQR